MSAPDKAQPVRAIFGHEPQRADEYPDAYIVGGMSNSFDTATKSVVTLGPITRIAYREEYLGDHSDAYFDVFVGDQRIVTMGARAVALVQYIVGEVQ